MATWTERISHPGRTLQNARFKSVAAWGAFRQEFLQAEPWVRARNRRQFVVDYGPAYIFLEPTNGCNLKCPYCPTGVGLQPRQRGFLKLDLVEKIVREIRHKPIQFGFWLAGEPMLHPEIVEMVGIAARAGLKPAMHSNATKLTPEVSEGLIKSGLDWVSFSFDGDNKEDYERMRHPAKYEDTIERIRTFLRIRKELRSKTPRVTLQTLIPYVDEKTHPYGIQVEAAESFRRQFDGYEVDEFKALLAGTWSGQLDGFEGVSPSHTRTGQRWNCIIPFRDMTITWNGDVVSCCGDLDGKNVIDSVAEKNLYDVWNGPNYQRFRKAMLSDEIERWPLCGQCERIWTEKPNPMDYNMRLEMFRYRLRF